MIDTLILDEKHEAQKRLTEEAGNDIETYFKNCHQNVLEMCKEYGVKIRYSASGKLKREKKIA